MTAQTLTTHSAPTPPRFVVSAGAHAGASFPLTDERCRIGSDLTCDVVLSDAVIAPEHFALQLVKRKGLRVEAVGADLHVDGTHVAQGCGYLGRLPVTLRIGEVEMHICAGTTGAIATPLRSWLDRRAAVVAGSVAGLGLCLFPFLAMSGASPRVEPEQPAQTSISVAPTSADPTEELRARLADANLQALRLDVQGSYLQVTGALDADRMQRWRDVQRWFDQTYGHSHLLHGAVSPAAPIEPPRVRVQAIWTGENPYVIGENGQRLYPGAAVDGGWVLASIEAERLLLRRDGAEFVLTL